MQEENIEIPESVQEVETPFRGAEPVAVAQPVKPPFFVFNFNTVLGVALLLGLIVLYALHFTGRSTNVSSPPLAVQKSAGKQLSVVFVNIDSLNTPSPLNYLFLGVILGNSPCHPTEFLSCLIHRHTHTISP